MTFGGDDPVDTSPSADMVQLYVNVQFKVKPLSTCTSSRQTKNIKFKSNQKKNFTKNSCIDTPKGFAKFQYSSTSIC